MSRALIIHRHADEDITAAAEWITQDSPERAAAFIEATQQTMRRLAEHPGAGALYATVDPALAGLRRFPVSGFDAYLIVYRYDDATVLIYRVVHGARDLASLMRGEASGP